MQTIADKLIAFKLLYVYSSTEVILTEITTKYKITYIVISSQNGDLIHIFSLKKLM